MEDKKAQSKQTNSDHNADAKDLKLRKEVDVDTEGNKIVVDRAREEDVTDEGVLSKTNPENPNINRGVITEKEAMKTVENKDLNSDITPNRYSNSNPESHKDRGNTNSNE